MLSHCQISKSNVVDDMVESNRILYEPKEKPDHIVSVMCLGHFYLMGQNCPHLLMYGSSM